jgi:hypothetical protein
LIKDGRFLTFQTVAGVTIDRLRPRVSQEIKGKMRKALLASLSVCGPYRMAWIGLQTVEKPY